MTKAIQRLLKATREWIIDEIGDGQKLREVVDKQRDEKSPDVLNNNIRGPE